jgi:hypothetical protein
MRQLHVCAESLPAHIKVSVDREIDLADEIARAMIDYRVKSNWEREANRVEFYNLSSARTKGRNKKRGARKQRSSGNPTSVRRVKK